MIAVYEIGHILDEDASPEKIFKEHSITPQWLQALLEKKEVQEQVTDDQLKLYKRAANDII
jgi:exoribonuclease R